MTSDRPSLHDPELAPVWERVRARLEKEGIDNRGRVRLPELTARARLVVNALIDRTVGATVGLADLERGLRRLEVGSDLPTALEQLGHPVSDEPARRRAERAAGKAARDAARREVATWSEDWAPEWIDAVIRTGCLHDLDEGAAVELVRSIRALLDHLAVASSLVSDTNDDAVGATSVAGVTPRRARVDLAARLFGSAHALDPGTKLGTAATLALAFRHQCPDGTDRAVWERAGAHPDLTSAPALTWGLPASGAVRALTGEADALGAPVHLSQFLLREHPVEVPAGADILVVENPRLVEAAAELRAPYGVVATNGNPSTTVQLLIDQLLTAGATLRYHGDFDQPGLAICGRMHDLGLVPWQMGADEYLAAVHRAGADGVTLPGEAGPAPATPWDPDLQKAVDDHRLAVHEEFFLPDLLIS